MTANETRALVVSKAKPAIGRNRYSQDSDKRECVFSPYKNGRYYSDCSSFARWLYRLVAILLNLPHLLNIGSNTTGIINNKRAVEIECKIKNGVPTDIDALRPADLLLFRGNDAGRSYARYVGHVEMVHSIVGQRVMLQGHGSGNPKVHEMKAYCRMRYLWKVANSKIKNRGLICVLRFIPDDPIIPGQPLNLLRSLGDRVNFRTGPSVLKKSLGKVKKGDVLTRTYEDTATWYGVLYKGQKAYISKRYAEVVS